LGRGLEKPICEGGSSVDHGPEVASRKGKQDRGSVVEGVDGVFKKSGGD